MEPSDVRSMCCRLRLDLRELRKKSGGYFGSGESTGSIGVVTINMPRIAYQAVDEADFYKRLDKMMDISARSLKVKRDVITKLLNEGLYPYTKHYLGTFANHFSTIGLVGMNEAGLNAKWIRKDMTHPECQQFTKDVLNHMRERLSDYQEMYGDLYNLEATPAESTSYRLAKHDVEAFPDIITAAEPGGTPYYTNSSHLPVSYTEDIFAALDIQDELQTLYTSGTVFHAFLGEKLPSWEAAANLVRKIAENYKLPYYTMSPTYSVCKHHGYLTGEQFTCPICGESAEVYSRITGYYRPVQNWNAGKTQEYKERKEYVIEHSTLTHKGPAPLECKLEEKPESAKAAEPEKKEEEVALLFATETCPNCKIACNYMDKAGFTYRKLIASENAELAKSLGIKQAPTLVLPDGTKFAGAGAIKAYVSQAASKIA
jgi:ribonucleoside-triphosphate reductase